MIVGVGLDVFENELNILVELVVLENVVLMLYMVSGMLVIRMVMVELVFINL